MGRDGDGAGVGRILSRTTGACSGAAAALSRGGHAMRYVYSVARFVPDPIRGECVNLGVIVGSDRSCEWAIRTGEPSKTARALDRRRLLPPVVAHLERIAGTIDQYVAAIDAEAT